MRAVQQPPAGGTERAAGELREKRVCASCVREKWMSERLRETGFLAQCGYCGRAGSGTWSVGALADSTLEAIRRHYECISRDSAGNTDYAHPDVVNDKQRKSAKLITGLISEMLNLEDRRVAVDIRKILEERVDMADRIKPKQECLFDVTSEWNYQSERSDELIWHWEDLEMSLKTETRLFNPEIEGFFDTMFSAASRLAQNCGVSLIMTLGPGTGIDKVYRSRVFQSERKLESAMENPDVSLGAPSPKLAKAGRMNSSGIPVFYGATSPGITLSETRPPVGSAVFTATFEMVRPLRVLNATALGKLYASGSYFDPNYDHKGEKACADFCKRMRARISRPVMPDDEEHEYLATQAMAEYLSCRHDPPLDGILFESSQGKHEGYNLVLFSQACKVEPLGCPLDRTDFVISKTWKDGEEGFPYYHVKATVRDKPASAQPSEANGPGKPESGLSHDISLRLDIGAMEIHHITGIHVKDERRPVSWEQN